MKTLMVTVLAIGLASSNFAQAQGPGGGKRGNAGGRHVGKMREALASLSPEERAKLHGAHAAAISDPSVQANRERMRQSAREFHESVRAAMLKADPSVQPILDKLPKKQPGEQP